MKTPPDILRLLPDPSRGITERWAIHFLQEFMGNPQYFVDLARKDLHLLKGLESPRMTPFEDAIDLLAAIVCEELFRSFPDSKLMRLLEAFLFPEREKHKLYHSILEEISQGGYAFIALTERISQRLKEISSDESYLNGKDDIVLGHILMTCDDCLFHPQSIKQHLATRLRTAPGLYYQYKIWYMLRTKMAVDINEAIEVMRACFKKNLDRVSILYLVLTFDKLALRHFRRLVTDNDAA